jgi:hypothetical protein
MTVSGHYNGCNYNPEKAHGSDHKPKLAAIVSLWTD